MLRRTSRVVGAVHVNVMVRLAAAIALVALVVPTAAFGDYGMTVRKKQVRPGEQMTLWGNGCFHSPRFHLGMRVYMVAARHLTTNTVFKLRPPGPPWHFLGRFRCTHTRTPQPWGDGGYWTATLRFRVPRVSPDRYQLHIYCPPCRKGPGANLVANNYYFDGKRRHGLGALVVVHR